LNLGWTSKSYGMLGNMLGDSGSISFYTEGKSFTDGTDIYLNPTGGSANTLFSFLHEDAHLNRITSESAANYTASIGMMFQDIYNFVGGNNFSTDSGINTFTTPNTPASTINAQVLNAGNKKTDQIAYEDRRHSATVGVIGGGVFITPVLEIKPGDSIETIPISEIRPILLITTPAEKDPNGGKYITPDNNGLLPNNNGILNMSINPEFQEMNNGIFNSDATDKLSLYRPYIRRAVRAEVEAVAPKTDDGKFIDPNTLQVIEGKYDLGHTYGNEFWRVKETAESEGLTQKEFNDKMNNPDLYQIEDPSSNRSHQFEKKGE